MKNLSLLSLLLCLNTYYLNAQFKIPAAFVVAKGVNDSVLTIKSDFNQDGIVDLFEVIEKDENAKLIAFLSAPKRKTRTISHKDMADFACCSSISYEKNVITVTTRGMRYFQNYKFRYDKKIMNFVLIGYDTESFGNAVNDGAGTQSVNLITGLYTFSNYTAKDEKTGSTKSGKRKLKFPKKYTLSNFNEAVSFLEKLK